MPAIHQLIYISTARAGTTGEDCQSILRSARASNRGQGITGMLLFNSKRFLQVLEGEKQVVRATYDRISADPRHAALVVLSEKDVAAREFGEWDMAYDDGTAGSNLRDRTLALLEQAGPSTRALFETTAQLHRA